MARKAISHKKRFEVFKRDSFTCQYCGSIPPQVVLHVDHIHPVALGGDNGMDNLITSCSQCNLGKSATPLDSVPQSLSDKAEDVKEREAQIRGYRKIMDQRKERLDSESWEIAEVLDPGCGESGFKRDQIISVKQFIEKLGYHEVLEAAEITTAKFKWFGRSAFSYFCGICWNKIRNAENG